ncbi:MAG TPA: family 16 glycoside hydrolase, partial [Gemmataceae bacterium]
EDSISPDRPRKSGGVRPRRAATVRERTTQKKWLLGGGIGVGVFLLALLGMWAGGVFKVKTKDGTIVLENLPADAEVLVDGERVTLKTGDGKTIAITAGNKHQLQVKKEGFKVFGKEVEIDAGERRPIRVTLLPEPPPIKPPPPGPEPMTEDNGFVRLFNGKDLTGWSVDGGPPGQWTVEGNTIVGQSKNFSTRNYLLTDKDYADFVLRFDYKVEDGSNGGVAIRAIEGEKVPQGGTLLFDHPILKLTNPTMSEKQPTGTAHWVKSAATFAQPIEVLSLPAGVWHPMEVIVRGENCKATVAGKQIVNLTLDSDARNNGAIIPGLQRSKGKVGFQINTGVVRYRKIEIKELPAATSPEPPKRAASDQGAVDKKNPVVVMETPMGAITIELNVEKAPITVKNFLEYVDDKFYDGLTFHRVISNFMIQGGGFEPGLKDAKSEEDINFKKKKTRAPIKNESGNGLSNTRGTIAMARTNNPDSATSQFYINVADNSDKLDRPRYCVFGKVIEGMDVVDKIKNVETKNIAVGGKVVMADVPVEEVVIKSILPALKSAMTTEQGFVPLFNGKDLTGWKTHPQQPGNWRVENGILIGSGPSLTSHLYTERGDYTDFHLRLQARINEGGNSGVYFRTPFGPTRPAGQPRWLNGYNAKIDQNRLGGFLLDDPTVKVPLVRSRDPAIPAGQWLTLEVIVQGNHIVVKTNGETTAEYTDEKRCFASGHIALQQHTSQTVVEFRKIEIKAKDKGKLTTTASGLKYEDLQEGTGEAAKKGDRVEVHYTGWLTNGTKFDSSLDRNKPFEFKLGGGKVVKGWDEGVTGMKVGGKRKLTIPPELGYGARGAGRGVIPPNATLLFEIELLKIE